MTQTFQEALVQRALAEWDWFGKDEGREDKYIDDSGATTTKQKSNGKANRTKERVPPYVDRIADYWLAIESKDYNKLVADHAKAAGKLDGTTPLAWSAAFISYCMQLAGAGKSFPYSSGHATWIRLAISNKKKDQPNANLVGYKLGQEVLRAGDLIGRSRIDKAAPEPPVTYDTALGRDWFVSHTDIVVEIDQAKQKATVVGGNVGQSVSKVTINLDAQGRPKAEGEWFVHIRNNIALPTPVAVASSKLSINVG